MEKPLSLDVREARQLVELANSRGVVLAVNYCRRYSAGHRRIRDLIQAEALGPIQRIAGYYTKGLFHNGTHWIDLARWLFGEIESVHGHCLRGWDGSDGQADAVLRFRTGAVGFLMGLDAEAFSLFEMDIVGTRQRVRVTDSGYRLECFEVGESPYFTGYRTLLKSWDADGDMEDTLLHAVADLVWSLRENRTPECSGADGLAALEVAAAVVESARASGPRAGSP